MDKSLKEFLINSHILDVLKSTGDKYVKSLDSNSLITIFEQQLYVWHDDGATVLTVNISNGSECKASAYKKLLLTNPPFFDVECLIINRLGNLLALYGSKGIMVMEIPWEVGKLRAYASDNNCMFCRSWSLADKIFAYSSRVKLLQASWYPGCKSSTYIMILSSDNYLRLYDTMDLPKPLQAISLGVNPQSSHITNEFSISLPSCIGESAVSFDFGLPEKLIEVKGENYEIACPIYVLHGNGDLYVVKMSIKKSGIRSAGVIGPLSMYPPAEDNYGVDACSVLCLPTNPPVLVLAMSSGILYHCLILEDSVDTGKSQISWSNVNNPALYVHGSVQLPIFVTPEDDVYSKAIRLYPDISANNKYHCTIVSGVYTVAIPFIKKMKSIKQKGDSEQFIMELLENDYIIEHLLCTQSVNSVSPVPVLGLCSAFRNSGIYLICLLSSWEFECLPLLSSFQSCTPTLLSSEIANPPEDITQPVESFEDCIKHILHRSYSTPILKSGTNSDTNVSSKQWLDLIYSTTHHLREEYIQRFYAAKALMDTRVKILMHHKQYQMLELERLMRTKLELQNNTEHLAAKYDDALCAQHLLYLRLENVLRALDQKFPCLSTAEANMKTELESIQTKIEVFQSSLDKLKKKIKTHEQKLKENKHMNDSEGLVRQMSNMQLGDTQLKHIKELLQLEDSNIRKLMNSATVLKKEIMLFT